MPPPHPHGHLASHFQGRKLRLAQGQLHDLNRRRGIPSRSHFSGLTPQANRSPDAPQDSRGRAPRYSLPGVGHGGDLGGRRLPEELGSLPPRPPPAPLCWLSLSRKLLHAPTPPPRPGDTPGTVSAQVDLAKPPPRGRRGHTPDPAPRALPRAGAASRARRAPRVTEEGTETRGRREPVAQGHAQPASGGAGAGSRDRGHDGPRGPRDRATAPRPAGGDGRLTWSCCRRQWLRRGPARLGPAPAPARAPRGDGGDGAPRPAPRARTHFLVPAPGSLLLALNCPSPSFLPLPPRSPAPSPPLHAQCSVQCARPGRLRPPGPTSHALAHFLFPFLLDLLSFLPPSPGIRRHPPHLGRPAPSHLEEDQKAEKELVCREKPGCFWDP